MPLIPKNKVFTSLLKGLMISLTQLIVFNTITAALPLNSAQRSHTSFTSSENVPVSIKKKACSLISWSLRILLFPSVENQIEDLIVHGVPEIVVEVEQQTY